MNFFTTCKRILFSSIAFGSLIAITPSTTFADTVSMYENVITVNGQTDSTPYGFVDQGTTYMPLYYVIQVLKSLGITNYWNGLTGIWSLTNHSLTTFTPLNQIQNEQQIQINGSFFVGMKTLIATDPSTGVNTTYVPIYDIIQVLNLFKINNNWNGSLREWTINSTNSMSFTTTYGVYHDLPLQNSAINDTNAMNRINEDYYLSAQTYNPLNNPPSIAPKLLNVGTGQTLNLFAYSDIQNVDPSQTTWWVDSPYAAIQPDHTLWTQTIAGTQLDEAHATFVASKPGIYTVQADINGNDSVPLVITVGYSQLQHVSITPSTNQVGIQLFPQTSPDFSKAQSFQIGIPKLYDAIAFPSVNQGWIPVAGFVPTSVQQVSIILEDSTGHIDASYTAPVFTSITGQSFYRAEVQSPIAYGSLVIAIIPNYPQYLTQQINNETPTLSPLYLSYQMTDGTTLSQSQLDLMPTAKIDYNMSPAFQTIAETLMENAPSLDAGIQAINNYVSDDLAYDQSELQPGGYRFQDSLQTLNSGTGICEDYAELTASLLRSIGIPTETIQGTAQDFNGDLPQDPSQANHEWVKAWDGNQWVVMDPTWSGGGVTNGGYITNEYLTNTNAFSTQHVAQASGVATTF